jgi:hypothetical protein
LSTKLAWQAFYSWERIHLAFHKNIAISHANISETTKNIAIHHKSTSSMIKGPHQHIIVITIIWEKRILKSIDTNAIYDTKMLKMICYRNERCMIHMYMRSPTQAQKGYTTPSSRRKWEKVSWSKGLVKISASCFRVGTCIKSMFPFSTSSLKKWYLTYICLVLQWSTRCFAMLMALVLSHKRGTWVHS